MQIIPTVLEKEWVVAEKRIDLLKGTTTWVQIDVIDGIFSEGKSFELELLSRYETGDNLLWDIHLMVKEPINWIEKCVFAGASRIIGQVEMMSDRNDFVKKVRDNGLEAGLAFKIGTEVTEIPEENEIILLMGRKTGFGSFEMENGIIDKVRLAKKYGMRVGVDGGVNQENMDKIRTAGADVVYSGSNYFDLKNVN